jgi:hypothetical protein
MEQPKGPEEKEGTTEDPSRQREGAQRPIELPTLSPEEQMEKYEEDLKENDWGHQPC